MKFRKSIHCYVTDEAHKAWNDFADEHGVSLSSLIEALAPTEQVGPTHLHAFLDSTREIGNERRRRPHLQQ